MYPTTQTPDGCQGGKDSKGPCPPKPLNAPVGDCKSNDVVDVHTSTTTVRVMKDSTMSPDVTRSGCFGIPLRSGGVLSLAWYRQSGAGANEASYTNGKWRPGGVSAFFAFLPLVNSYLAGVGGRRVYIDDITYSYNSSMTPQVELPLTASIGTTYFTEYDQRIGVYFEYWAGTSDLTSTKFGRLNRRYDSYGNELHYNYTNQNTGIPLLRSISGSLLGRVVPYFYYESESMTGGAPITKIHLLDLEPAQDHRTLYFEYTTYSESTFKYLTKIIHPDGCVKQYDARMPSYTSGIYQQKREVDQEGYQTYFEYSSSSLIKTIEPEGRITYFNYVSTSETRQTLQGRATRKIYYSKGSTGNFLPMVNRDLDLLGNATYFGYTAPLNRVVKRIGANENLTYYEYVGGSADNKYAISKVLSVANGAATFYGYDGGRYDLAKTVNPLGATTYYTYDINRNRTSVIDALGNATLFGFDSFGRQYREQNAQGNTTYFNYSDSSGFLDTVVDAEGDISYFGYNSFGARLREVSPRWTETGSFDGFTTYYGYDRLDRQTKAIDPLGAVTYFDWTSRGDLSAKVDARGTDTSFTYNGLRLLTRKSVTDIAGAVLFEETSGYDVYKNLIQSQDGLGNATYFFYDQNDRLTGVKDALQNITYFYYDSVGNETTRTNSRNYTTYYFYDSLSRQNAVRDAQGSLAYFFYDLADNRTHSVDARGNSVYFFYDALNRVNALRDALANPTYYYYDEMGNESAIRNARFYTTYYFYDKIGRRTKTGDALGRYTYFDYNAARNITQVVGARQDASTFFYDANDRLTVWQDAVGNRTYFTYDAVANLTELTDARNNTTYFFSDGLNRRKALRDALGNYTYYFYDLASNRTAVRNPLLHTSYFGYSALRRLSRIQDALGKTTYLEYDAVGNWANVIDPKNQVSSIRYDALNHPDAVRSPDGGSAYFFYDTTSNLTNILDPRGNATYFGYDAVNRGTRITDALGRTIYFEYDVVSNISKVVGAEGESAASTFDAVNRRTNIAYAAAGTVISDGLRSDPYFIYDEVGNLAQMGDLWGLHLMEYDLTNRLIRHLHPNTKVVYFEYDGEGNRTAVAYPGTAGSAASNVDAKNRQTKLKAPSGGYAYFTYDAASNLTQRVLGNSVRLEAAYDLAERSSRWRYTTGGGTPLSYFDYTRDDKGLITESFREATHTVYYAYDANDRLTMEVWATSGNAEVYGYRYAYDPAGNRTVARMNGSNTYYYYDRANQLIVKGTDALYASPTYYEYDQNGSLVKLVESGGNTTFAYNAAMVIARISWKDASSTYFFYDGALQRYAIRRDSTTNYFLWDGLDILQELNADGTVKEEHTHAKTLIPGIGQLVESYRPAEAAEDQKIYPIMDSRGTIYKYVKSDGTSVLASREYDAFGQIIPNSAVGTWPNRFGYQGQSWLEILSGNGSQRLLLTPTRLYDPTDGRFLQNEPIIRQRSLVQYLYCLQRPFNLVDPSGRKEVDVILWHLGPVDAVAQAEVQRIANQCVLRYGPKYACGDPKHRIRVIFRPTTLSMKELRQAGINFGGEGSQLWTLGMWPRIGISPSKIDIYLKTTASLEGGIGNTGISQTYVETDALSATPGILLGQTIAHEVFLHVVGGDLGHWKKGDDPKWIDSATRNLKKPVNPNARLSKHACKELLDELGID